MAVCKPTGLIKPGDYPPPLTAAYWTAPKPREAMATAMMTAFASEVLPVRNGSRKAAQNKTATFGGQPQNQSRSPRRGQAGRFSPRITATIIDPQEHDYCRREFGYASFACPDRNPLSYGRCFCFPLFLLLILSFFYTFFLFSMIRRKMLHLYYTFFTKTDS